MKVPETANEAFEPLGLRMRQEGRRDDQVFLATAQNNHVPDMAIRCSPFNGLRPGAAFGRWQCHALAILGRNAASDHAAFHPFDFESSLAMMCL